ncbi:SusD-like starch-binding protein associating with outer membrane [Chitinophaga skermanii]|uniref:SusD-like starch-binding protein associating with outer membrane n=1 Tax=Chitinophaga skermanii TaxID=331697 RepID=A0A327QYB6_9BACT|nr:RagB/SusD family nutrient uptake outer membrane protein [Chitinophaga skermanii]RAJ08748.1 SusD-like starch-binding protein associating with outer membrane [Chitinophaga skermanii]
MKSYYRYCILFSLGVWMMLHTGCKKLLEIDEPKSSITGEKVFNYNEQAEAAMDGVYSRLINGVNQNWATSGIQQGFAAGMYNVITGLSADEYTGDPALLGNYYPYNQNKVSQELGSSTAMVIWESAYVCINGTNAILEGIAASKSSKLTAATRTRLNGEAYFLRAYAHFQLLNVFGDVPLVLTTNFNVTRSMPRTPMQQVYQQIEQDLLQAENLLDVQYNSPTKERIRPNKFAAKALLARLYLYKKEYAKAAQYAGEVIAEKAFYNLSGNLNDVFLKNSTDAIWQLKQTNALAGQNNAVPEVVSTTPNAGGLLLVALSGGLHDTFEPNDARKQHWVGETSYLGQHYWYNLKYKVTIPLSVPSGDIQEYYMQARLSEQYLIRAEALLLGTNDKEGALSMLAPIRARAGLTTPAAASVSNDEVVALIMHERQVELFGEGHRWLDLRRTNQATAVLSKIPLKQPWKGDDQLLYPVPASEILTNPNLKQNKGY